VNERIDLDRARDLLIQAVLTRGPDFQYATPGETAGCVNVPAGEVSKEWWGDSCPPPDSPKRKTGCVVGTAMKLSGIVPPEKHFPTTGTVVVFTRWLTPQALSYLKAAQDAQDMQATWGEAFWVAEKWAKENL